MDDIGGEVTNEGLLISALGINKFGKEVQQNADTGNGIFGSDGVHYSMQGAMANVGDPTKGYLTVGSDVAQRINFEIATMGATWRSIVDFISYVPLLRGLGELEGDLVQKVNFEVAQMNSIGRSIEDFFLSLLRK